MGWADAFAYQSAADIFAEHAALSAFENDGSRAFDIGALANTDYDALDPNAMAGQSIARHQGTARLFAEGGFPTPDTRARFVAVQAEGPATSTSAEYPLHPEHRPHPRPVAHHDPHWPCAAPVQPHRGALRRSQPGRCGGA